MGECVQKIVVKGCHSVCACLLLQIRVCAFINMTLFAKCDSPRMSKQFLHDMFVLASTSCLLFLRVRRNDVILSMSMPEKSYFLF